MDKVSAVSYDTSLASEVLIKGSAVGTLIANDLGTHPLFLRTPEGLIPVHSESSIPKWAKYFDSVAPSDPITGQGYNDEKTKSTKVWIGDRWQEIKW